MEVALMSGNLTIGLKKMRGELGMTSLGSLVPPTASMLGVNTADRVSLTAWLSMLRRAGPLPPTLADADSYEFTASVV